MYGFESKYRRTHEIDLLFHYHAELGKRGIDLSKHTIENSAFHFADEAGFMFAQQIIAIKDMAKKIEQDPNMGAMFVTVLKRLDIFIQDWDIANMDNTANCACREAMKLPKELVNYERNYADGKLWFRIIW